MVGPSNIFIDKKMMSSPIPFVYHTKLLLTLEVSRDISFEEPLNIMIVALLSTQFCSTSLINRTESSESRFRKYTRVVVTTILVQVINRIHFICSQVKVENGSVFLHPYNTATLADRKSIPLNSPAQHHLSYCFVVPLANRNDGWIVEQEIICGCHVEANVRSSAQWRER